MGFVHLNLDRLFNVAFAHMWVGWVVLGFACQCADRL